MSVFKCKMCGGTLEINPGETVGTCEYCGTKQTLPKLDDDRKANMFDRANHFRRNNDYDKAASIYEQILNEDNTDAETYWSLVLCRYGIEYVEDPGTHKRIPTVNRAQFTSIFDDEDYKSAIQHADIYQRSIYEEEANVINEIQKGILAISQKEEPFDVFICYKETDNNGRRTQDSVLANDLYHQLTQEGFKVFFSRITLEDKLGTAYEPYIFAALNSAKVMVVLGTKPEHFNAVWVKNEWSRYLVLVKQSNGKKVLIPAYRDMDPYDLPGEFSHLQAQDMGKLGFMQDLIRGIKKIVQSDSTNSYEKVYAVSESGVSIAPLLKRAFIFLEDGSWNEADAYCEKVLDHDPENAQAYLGKLMAELKVKTPSDLAKCSIPFDKLNNYLKVVRFGDDKLVNELNGYIDTINNRNEDKKKQEIFNSAKNIIDSSKDGSVNDYKRAIVLLKTISGFKNADELVGIAEDKIKAIYYMQAIKRMDTAKTDADYKEAADAFRSLERYKDATTLEEECLKKAEVIREEVEAVIKALLAGPDKSDALTEDAISEANQKKKHLEDLFDNFQNISDSIIEKRADLTKIDAKSESLVSERSSLGLFAGKEKKRIDLELTELGEKREKLNAELEKLTAKQQGYTSKGQIGNELNQIIETISELEAKQLKERENGTSKYTYEEAVKYYKNNAIAVSSVDHLIAFKIAECGDVVYFGSYMRDSIVKKEPIEWQILEKNRNKILLISKYGLDCKQYNSEVKNCTWETCSLREWLNTAFLQNAFTSKEQSMIDTSTVTADANPKYNIDPGNDTFDKIFLLSIPEVEKYFKSVIDRQCHATAYAKAKGNYVHNDNYDNCWWLRSPGRNSVHAAFINEDGSVVNTGFYVYMDTYAVRPALWINLDEKKETDNTNFESNKNSEVQSENGYPQVLVKPDKCVGCGLCFKSCPTNAFYFESFDGNKLGRVAAINHNICVLCTQCVDACKFGAVVCE